MGGEAFSYRTAKDGVVRILWEGRCVVTLGGSRGRALTAELAGADPNEAQALQQRATDNSKRGNERRGGRPR